MDANGLCIFQNCKEFNYQDLTTISTKICLVCKDGMLFKKLDTIMIAGTTYQRHYCYPNTNLNDDCLNYSPELGHCVKCRDSSKIPYVVKTSSGENNVVECVDFNSNLDELSIYNVDYLYVKYDSSTSPQTSYLKRVETSSQVLRTFSQNSNSTQTHCLKNRTVPNCKPDLLLEGLYCSKCEQGFYLDNTTNSCLKISIDNCLEVIDNQNRCSKCDKKYYPSNDNTACIHRLLSGNCKVAKDNYDLCESCFKGLQWLNPTQMLCKDYSVSNCEEFAPELDSCEKCNPGYWRKKEAHSVYSCKEYSASNCWKLDPDTDNCLMCKKGFIKTGNSCEEGKIDNCELIDRNLNICLVCSGGYYRTENSGVATCIKNSQVPKCEIYRNYENKCKICREGYYFLFLTNECLRNPSGVKNCKHYSDKDTCKTCETNYYLTNNSCIEVLGKVTDCIEYSSPTECIKCSNSMFLSLNECKVISAWNCSEYKSEKMCKSCIANHILDETNGTCTFSGIANCIEFETAEPIICLKCSAGFIPNDTKSSCIVPSPVIPNCREYSSSTECSSCDPNYYTNIDKSACLSLSNDIAGQSCDRAEMKKSLRCDVCWLGYYLGRNGKCYGLPLENCLVFDWESLVCSLCRTDSYMDKFGFCKTQA